MSISDDSADASMSEVDPEHDDRDGDGDGPLLGRGGLMGEGNKGEASASASASASSVIASNGNGNSNGNGSVENGTGKDKSSAENSNSNGNGNGNGTNYENENENENGARHTESRKRKEASSPQNDLHVGLGRVRARVRPPGGAKFGRDGTHSQSSTESESSSQDVPLSGQYSGQFSGPPSKVPRRTGPDRIDTTVPSPSPSPTAPSDSDPLSSSAKTGYAPVPARGVAKDKDHASTHTMQEEKKVSDGAPPDWTVLSLSQKLQQKAALRQKGNKQKAEPMPVCDAAFRSLVNLDPVPATDSLPKLTPKEFAQLESSLQIGDKYAGYTEHHVWREDWNGNLQLVDKDLIMNKEDLVKDPEAKKVTMQFCDWVAKLARHSDDFTAVEYLFSFIYNIQGTPRMAKQILAHSLLRPAASVAERLKFVTDASRRISYDPTVLNQDGWTTAKSDVPDGHTGGSYLIGRRVFWHNFEAIVIAFVRDEDIGDLWKCLWIEDQDTFDLEADELQEGMKKWEKKIAKRRAAGAPTAKQRPSIRFEANRNFTVSGIEDGIILAKSYKSKSGRPWPARVMHVTEVKALGNQLGSRRSSSKNEIHVVFLAPFWNCENSGSAIPTATSLYATGPLFELESIDVSSDTIQRYPHARRSDDASLSITDLQSEFNFLGLPKAAFPRFLDAHRMASALKIHAMKENRKRRHMGSIDADATASLTDTHPLSIKAFSFPDALLNLPFGYILSKFPELSNRSRVRSTDLKEPVMQLQLMLDSLVPPNCWGKNADIPSSSLETPVKKSHQPLSVPHSRGLTPTMSPALNASLRVSKNDGEFNLWDNGSFASDYLMKLIKPSPEGKRSLLHSLYDNLQRLVKALNKMVIDLEEGATSNLQKRQEMLASIIVQCITAKGHCEDFLFSADLPDTFNKQNILIEWRKACERVYKRAIVRLGHLDSGNGVMAVLTDSRCNEHITANGSFERAVRLPAAIKGAKNAGVGSRPSLPLITKIEDSYLTLAEEIILPMAHKTSYLKRMKTKITNLAQDAKGVPLTDGSDGEGGEDTSKLHGFISFLASISFMSKFISHRFFLCIVVGSRGSFTAAVAGVAAALKGVDMIMGGKCVNAFCAVRPPGHHAGRSLRPMNAISNGFCLLNAAAGAALYAATPRSQGGLGLKRVCVIDFDVHHGNGTQDILCSTHDPRFLYVSTHAGGPHINGYEDDNSNDGFRRSLNTNKNEGIFPGRCGDTSPHPGVLNVPLGKKVTPSALGTALVCEVTPKVGQFDPELIIISAGFDAHVNDPLGMGGLTAENFGTVTKVICQMAMKSCSGRILSILEGGYGVPCCRPLDKDTFLPKGADGSQLRILDLGGELPDDMDDGIDTMLAKKLDKCHQEGFLECVEQHVRNLALNSNVDA